MATGDPIRRLGGILRERGFTEGGLEQALAGLTPDTAESLRTVHPPGDERLAPLVELFGFGLPVAVERVAGALAPLEVALLDAEGLVREHAGLVSAPLRITPFAGFLLLHDPWSRAQLPRDYVGGPSEAAETLAQLTIRRPSASALDLGTGCGVQALSASRHVDRVLATDLNPRACAFAELNVRLNGVENVELRSGDLFEPVGGERFDLIVANPPYVISPASDLLFRDSGLAPGELCGTVLAEAARHLRVGGFACVLVNWATNGSAGRWDVPRSWTQERGCDVCAFSFGPEPVLPYAARWSEPPASADDQAHAEEVRRWLAFYEQSDIDTIWFGGLVLRRREGPNWFRAIDLGSAGSGSGADHIARIFEATDFLEADPELGEARFAPAPGSRLTHVLEHSGEGFELGEATVALAEGLGIRGRIDPLAVHVLVQLDGQRRLSEVVDAVAAERGLERPALAEESFETVSRLYGLGLLDRPG